MGRRAKDPPEPFSASALGMSAASLQPAAPRPVTLSVSHTPNHELTVSLGLGGGSFQRVVYTRAI